MMSKSDLRSRMWGRMTFTLRNSVERTADNTDKSAYSADTRAAASRRYYLGIEQRFLSNIGPVAY
jgi:hypothetical protein